MKTIVIAPERLNANTPTVSGHESLGGVLLHRNAYWFVRIRWAVVGVLGAGAMALHLLAEPLAGLGVINKAGDLAVAAAALAAANAVFLLAVRRLRPDSPPSAIRLNLWLQIAVDLGFVTWLVHIFGSTATFMPFTYLFHVVLACIFFPSGYSLLVTALASLLYGGCVAAELVGFLPGDGILHSGLNAPDRPPMVSAVLALSAISIWFVVWFLTSTLSQAVRRRDADLAEANEQLVRAEQERNALMLRTVHDLKAPFAGIESNIEILRSRFWDSLPPAAQDLVARIDKRSQSLRLRIRDILQLGDLRTMREDKSQPPIECNIGTVLEQAIGDIQERAAAMNVTIRTDVHPLSVRSWPKHLHALFSNLCANAVVYSRPGGQVEVTSRQSGSDVVVSIADHGIGIDEKALPRIFDEYYRSSDAAEHNPHSTGLGMAIVKEVARQLDLQVSVSSEKGVGTTVEVTIPVVPSSTTVWQAPEGAAPRQE